MIYSIVFVLALFLGSAIWIWRLRQVLKIPVEESLRWALLTSFFGVLGAQALGYLFFPAKFSSVSTLGAGATAIFQGGLLGALGCLLILLRKNPQRFDIFRLLAGPAALGHALGRLGCVHAGCCYGQLCPLPYLGERYPTQALESIGLAVLGMSIWNSPKAAARYLWGYGALRFVLEFLRGEPRFFLGPLSSAQWISLTLILTGLWLDFRGTKRDNPLHESRNRKP